MKKFSCILFFFGLLMLWGCSSDEENNQKYIPVIVDEGGIINDSTIELINAFIYPEGVIPVFVTDSIIKERIYTSAIADNKFEEYTNIYEGFEDFGMLIYLTQDPQLIQVRLGSIYSAYADFNGATQGVDYLRVQEKYKNGEQNSALIEMLKLVSDKIVDYKESPNSIKARTNDAKWALNNVFDWFGSPSEKLYGTYIIKPIYKILAFGMNYIGSWLVGLGLVFLFIYLIKIVIQFLISLIIVIVIKDSYLRKACIMLIGLVVGGVMSFTVAGCAIVLSSGRMEDYISLAAFGIPYLDSFLVNPDLFVNNSNIWLAILFAFLVDFSFECSNDIYIISLLPAKRQMEIWNNMSEENQDFLLSVNNVFKVFDGETPYMAILRKASTKRRFYITPLTIGALLCFSKILLYIGIVLSLLKLLPYSIKFIGVFKYYWERDETAGLLGRIIGSIFSISLPIIFVLIIYYFTI